MKITHSIVAMLLAAPLLLMSQERPASIPIAPQLGQSVEGLDLWWTGNAGWLMRRGDVLLGVDLILEEEPFLDEFSMTVRYDRPLRAADLGGLTYSIVTHAHGDHFGRVTSRVLLERSKCRFVLPRSCLAVADELQIPEDRRIIAEPGREIRLPGVTIHPLHALHGDRYGSVYREANFEDCGYVLDFGGTRVLHPGDSVLLQEQLELKDIAVLLVSITEHNTWIENSARLANQLEPELILPMHYDTYTKDIFWTVGQPKMVKALLKDGLADRFRPVRQGERVQVHLRH
jgi:L-ascorbate metabolism protein UlaG (beta-lactamase superfamily)